MGQQCVAESMREIAVRSSQDALLACIMNGEQQCHYAKRLQCPSPAASTAIDRTVHKRPPSLDERPLTHTFADILALRTHRSPTGQKAISTRLTPPSAYVRPAGAKDGRAVVRAGQNVVQIPNGRQSGTLFHLVVGALDTVPRHQHESGNVET